MIDPLVIRESTPQTENLQDAKDYASKSRGGKPLKPTHKFQKMQWIKVGGRGNCDR